MPRVAWVVFAASLAVEMAAGRNGTNLSGENLTARSSHVSLVAHPAKAGCICADLAPDVAQGVRNEAKVSNASNASNASRLPDARVLSSRSSSTVTVSIRQLGAATVFSLAVPANVSTNMTGNGSGMGDLSKVYLDAEKLCVCPSEVEDVDALNVTNRTNLSAESEVLVAVLRGELALTMPTSSAEAFLGALKDDRSDEVGRALEQAFIKGVHPLLLGFSMSAPALIR